ncbi:aminotransferase class I/II-fold pyridoxal phosphate-dependent enzyme [Holzapfeliella floricola]|uniref:Aminotransferase n=1 Tax=Holzapfeliella floricola DSM 23037 = JCM 16512 TaxID=1423744 RepID=A0A0R2DTS6_9LACO|nr:aminotransferase class I/II-fold pyridoxal phosphate-dependent enzyme [Holzapfeliella floricola]KRN03549.1 aromatic-amino-acid transaminase [Holzapfeliella floricola DSM 23037 = JCM 16512]
MPQLSASLASQLNHHLEQIAPPAIGQFNQQISTIEGLIKLTIGEPDFDVPQSVKQAAITSIENNQSHYSATPGIFPLRKAIANYLKQYNLTYNPESEIVVTVGATEAIFATIMTMLNKGDKLVIPTPTFPLYFPVTELAQAECVMVDTSQQGFKLTPELLESVVKSDDSIKAILLNYPGNPTGVTYNKAELQALVKIIEKYDLFVISDEIYNELTYTTPHLSIAELLPERTVLINGVSKSHAMTGYRIGYVAGPQEFMKLLTKIHGLMVTSTSNPAQYAALEALENGLAEPKKMKQAYQERRDFLYQSLVDLGFEVTNSQGAFYLFVKVPDSYQNDDKQFGLDLAYEAKVGTMPGYVFGEGGQGYLRLSYAASLTDLKQAVKNIAEFLKLKGIN